MDIGDGTVVDAIARRLRGAGADVLSHVVDADGRSRAITRDELKQRIAGYASTLRRSGAPEVVVVCLYPGIELLAAFLGAIWAGQIPTMIAPPSPRMDAEKYSRSFIAMMDHIKPSAVVMDEVVLRGLDGLFTGQAGTRLMRPEDVASADDVAPHRGASTDIALLQHSSGTTGLQKGVALSHGAVLAHMRSYARRIGLRPDDVVVSWLPLYHDMGLIACLLLPIICEVPFVQMSPFDWARRPRVLFEKIAEHRGSLVWLPNFAYTFMADQIDPESFGSALPLATMRAWVNCSEPVASAAHRRFVEKFAALGAREDTLTASYAMAENVFAVTQSEVGSRTTVVRADRDTFAREHRVVPSTEGGDAVELVGNGKCLETTRVRVRSQSGELLADRCVGQIEIAGDHLFSGYWKRDDIDAFTEDGWYRTGDLGFVLDGEVFITGRAKDLIIIQGRNFYPADIESAVGSLDGVVPGRVVAFGVPDARFGTEGLVVLAESSEPDSASRGRLTLRIRKLVAQQFDCTAQDVRVLAERWLVKSTAGKLARADTRDKYLRELAGGAPKP